MRRYLDAYADAFHAAVNHAGEGRFGEDTINFILDDGRHVPIALSVFRNYYVPVLNSYGIHRLI